MDYGPTKLIAHSFAIVLQQRHRFVKLLTPTLFIYTIHFPFRSVSMPQRTPRVTPLSGDAVRTPFCFSQRQQELKHTISSWHSLTAARGAVTVIESSCIPSACVPTAILRQFLVIVWYQRICRNHKLNYMILHRLSYNSAKRVSTIIKLIIRSHYAELRSSSCKIIIVTIESDPSTRCQTIV